jgi:hypothetical protein
MKRRNNDTIENEEYFEDEIDETEENIEQDVKQEEIKEIKTENELSICRMCFVGIVVMTAYSFFIFNVLPKIMN